MIELDAWTWNASEVVNVSLTVANQHCLVGVAGRRRSASLLVPYRGCGHHLYRIAGTSPTQRAAAASPTGPPPPTTASRICHSPPYSCIDHQLVVKLLALLPTPKTTTKKKAAAAATGVEKKEQPKDEDHWVSWASRTLATYARMMIYTDAC